jgi:hypothetical protein
MNMTKTEREVADDTENLGIIGFVENWLAWARDRETRTRNSIRQTAPSRSPQGLLEYTFGLAIEHEVARLWELAQTNGLDQAVTAALRTLSHESTNGGVHGLVALAEREAAREFLRIAGKRAPVSLTNILF